MSDKDKKLTKFDFVVGNPPYQEENSDNNRQSPIYNKFMSAAYEIADKVTLITPARFLFNAGQTPKEWNEKILNDEHFKVLSYSSSSKEIFYNTDIKGGIAITYHDVNKDFGKIGTFTTFAELNSILNKVLKKDFISFMKIVYPKSSYKLTKKVYEDYPHLKGSFTKGNEFIVDANIFIKLKELFTENKKDNFVGIYGRENNKRTEKYINKQYISGPENFEHFKIFLPAANGSGAIGEVLSTPLIGEPLIGHTQTFISIGNFQTLKETENCMKYIKSKFARTLLGTLKITQNNNRDVFKNIPLQDFTNESDIDWSKSIKEIDQQLYKKYGLSEDEIKFIEEKVKEIV
jgi:hypothetical protein